MAGLCVVYIQKDGATLLVGLLEKPIVTVVVCDATGNHPTR